MLGHSTLLSEEQGRLYMTDWHRGHGIENDWILPPRHYSHTIWEREGALGGTGAAVAVVQPGPI